MMPADDGATIWAGQAVPLRITWHQIGSETPEAPIAVAYRVYQDDGDPVGAAVPLTPGATMDIVVPGASFPGPAPGVVRRYLLIVRAAFTGGDVLPVVVTVAVKGLPAA